MPKFKVTVEQQSDPADTSPVQVIHTDTAEVEASDTVGACETAAEKFRDALRPGGSKLSGGDKLDDNFKLG